MPRHPSVPDNQTRWIRLDAVTTDTAMIAIVAPESAGSLGNDWTARYLDEDGEPLERPLARHPSTRYVEFEDSKPAMKESLRLVTTHADGGYIIEGGRRRLRRRTHDPARGTDPDMGCCCTCHDSDQERQHHV